jgi:hypothetical protein
LRMKALLQDWSKIDSLPAIRNSFNRWWKFSGLSRFVLRIMREKDNSVHCMISFVYMISCLHTSKSRRYVLPVNFTI